MQNQDQIPEGSQNFMRALSEEISEIKNNTAETNSGIESINSKLEQGDIHDKVVDHKLEEIHKAIKKVPITEQKRIMLFPEFADYEFYKTFFPTMFIATAITVFAIVIFTKLLPIFKDDGHKYKKAWKELYSAAVKSEKYRMDSILFYTHGVKLDSMAQK